MRHIESLESRELLSAAPYAKVKPTIPNIVFDYTGTSQETHPLTDAEDISLSIASETTKGVFTGSFVSPQGNYTVTGSVTNKGKVTFKLIMDGKPDANVTGTYSTAHTITGTFKITRGTKASGIFSLTAVVG